MSGQTRPAKPPSAQSQSATRATYEGTSTCPGCALRLPERDGPGHPYVGASPACWAMYGQVLERAYSDDHCRDVLQLVVDTYACQHPGEPGRQSAQSVAIHLMTLCLILEDGADPRDGPALHRRMVTPPSFLWLEPPPERGQLTVASVGEAPTPAAYIDATWTWARDVWRAWEPHHAAARGGIRRTLSD